MKKRTLAVAGALGFLLTLLAPLHAQELSLQQIWVASGGEARLELRADYLTDFGLTVAADGRRVHEVVDIERALSGDDHLALAAPYGNFERFLSGSITLDTGWTLHYRGREVRLDGLTLTPGIDDRNGHPSLEARDATGRHLLTLTHLHIVAEAERGLLIVHNADIVAATGLSDLLGLKVLAGMPIGMAWFDLRLQIPAGADTSGLGPGCEDRPLWPQEGEPVDVTLIGMGTIAYQGTDPVTGGVKVAPSATLKNESLGDVPWIPKFSGHPEYPFEPGDQHPFLVWNMYRLVDGRIEQLADSGVKHAFLTLNQNCDLNCGDGHILWPGCEDVYSSGTNDSNSNLGPRDDIEASEGLFFSTCSFFDPGCSGSQTNSSGEYENRLLVDPNDLQTPGADYLFDSWYVIQYDTDIWNSMGYHPITPTPVSDGWDFNPGAFAQGRALDQWVDPAAPGPDAGYAEVVVPSATPDEPYPGNMPQGHINVAVRVTEPEAGHYRYNYAVQNFDFDRGVEAFRIPIPAGAQVFETYFGDIDDDAGNDWTVSTDGGFVSFEATTDHPLPWFTLFNFEIEVDAPPAASQVTLALGGDAVVPTIDAAILGPSAGGGGETHIVTVQNFEFVPAQLTINAGDTVVWDNIEGSHNVLADDESFTSGPPAPAPWTFSFTFDEMGSNPYYCEPHGGPGGEGMSGVITVIGESAPALSFDPAALEFGDVEVGTTSPPQIATLANTGDADATNLTFSGLPDGGFTADTSACGATLPVGGSCEVSVTFTPAAPGAAAATLQAASDEGATAALDVSGNGVGESEPFPEIELESFVTGLNEPIGLTHAGDGSDRLFVVQQSGEIRIISGGVLLPTPFLDISDLVSGGSEQGLLGLAFHPDYATNGFFYIDYTDLDGNTVVARYQVSAGDPDQGDPESAQIVLTQAQPFSNHNGGNVVFGPDGFLYIGLGDGGSGGDPQDNGQDLETWLGKILRLDVDGDDFPSDPDRNYAVPPDNPFVGVAGLDEIWAYGVRNPWRFTFDRDNGDLWIGDVGQGAFEEIDLQPAASEGGENYGWDVLEGGLQPGTPGPSHPNCFEDDPGGDGSCADFLTGGSTLPVLEYGHSLGCSVTGGYRYRGQLQAPMAGIYFYGDLCSGNMWGARPAGGGGWESEVLLQASFSITTFGEDEAGELYVVEYNGAESTLHRVVVPGTGAPELAFDPAVLDFGDVLVGTTSPPQSSTLTNTGDADATGLTFGDLPDSGFTADTSACGDTLPAGGSCTISVTFSPVAPGPVSATLNVESTEGATANLGLSGVGVDAEGPVADVSPESFEFTLDLGEVGTDTLSIGNLGDLDLEWNITTDGPDAAKAMNRLDHDPALDEPLTVPEFVIDSLPNGGEPVTFIVPAGVLTQGDVIGFSFIGTVSGINDSSSWASDMCMTLVAPDGTTYVVGGFSGVSLPGCFNAGTEEGNPWDFQGLPSDDDGTYESEHDNVLPAVGDAGDWTLTFVNDWESESAATHTWTDVTVTLHKQAPGLCGDVTDIPWLSADPDAGTTAPGASDAVTVSADSTAAGVGTHEAALCVNTNDPNAPVVPVPVTLTVLEVDDEPVLSFDPGSLDFGDVVVGETSAPQTATLSNVGDGDATNLTFSGLPDAGFAADTSACGATLPAGGSCAVSLTFTPAAPGTATATLHAASDEGAAADLGLSGNGVEGGEPVLSFDPSSLDFGDVEVGTTSSPQTAMLHNTGDAEATGVTLSGLPDAGFEADTSGCGDTLPAGGSCAVNVTFTPAVPGPAAATLHAASNEGAAADLGLAGNGVEGGVPILSFDPTSLDFGDVPVGETSAPQMSTLSNTGDADATGVTFSGLPANGFAVDTGACGDTLPAGGSCAVSVTFTPSVVGPATATLHVDSAEGAAADVGLSGNGVDEPQGPVADITPDSFSFEVPEGGGDSDTLTIGNLGGEDLIWSLDEAETALAVSEGAPYRYGLADMPAFNAPVGGDRASGTLRARGEAPADRVVLPAPQVQALGDFTEGFDDIQQLPGAGWAMINNSDPEGPSSWFQGNESIFPAHEGAPNAYIAANYESTAGNGTISNWLITPEVTIVNGTEACFWTRKSDLFGEFLDRLEVRMSDEGESTDVGETADSVGDFTTLLLTIEPDLELPNEYPEEWTEFCVTVRERSRQPVTGRFAFRYWVTDSGPDGTNGDYIGIDTVSVKQPDDVPPSCNQPSEIPWLAFDPTSGTTAPGASEPVTVTVDAIDLEAGDYEARLCVTTNDPTTPLVDVPVSLTVSESGSHFCDDVTSIPNSECRALVAIYETNGGENWELPGWLEDLDPCTWGSVTCELREGQNHVTRLLFLFTPFTGVLAPEVGDLSQLEVLQIVFHFGLTGLPAEVGNLTHLQSLSIEFGELASLPSTIGQLSALTSLAVSTNALTSLPAEIGDLVALEHIQASSNQIAALPASIGALTNLNTLLLQVNQITELPSGFSALQSVHTLDLSGNPFGGELPTAITELAALEQLIMTDAGLTGIPDAISNLQNLTVLDLYFNEIPELPATLAQLENLQQLGVSGNQLAEVPEWVAALPDLLFLRFADNLLTELPAALAGLTGLEVFDVADNQISGEIPAWLGTFSDMYSLFLGNNEFSGEVPVGLRDGTSIGGDFSVLQLSGNGCLTSTIDPTLTDWLEANDPNWDDGCGTVTD